MPKQLLKVPFKGKHIRAYLSNDWASKQPWLHDGLAIPYVCKIRYWSEDKLIYIDHFYLGPFAILYGALVENPAKSGT